MGSAPAYNKTSNTHSKQAALLHRTSISLTYVPLLLDTGHFLMFSMITNIYNKKTKGPTLRELFTATEKLKKFF